MSWKALQERLAHPFNGKAGGTDDRAAGFVL